MVADALSRKVTYIATIYHSHLLKELEREGITLIPKDSEYLANLSVRPTLADRIKREQLKDKWQDKAR